MFISIFLAIVVALGTCGVNVPNWANRMLENKQSLHDLSGNKYNAVVEAVPENVKLVILTFWKVDCPYCIKQLQELQRLRYNTPSEIEIVAVNVGDSDSNIKRVVVKYGLSYMVLAGIKESPGSGLPITGILVYDKESAEWVTVKIWEGLVTAEQIYDFMNSGGE